MKEKTDFDVIVAGAGPAGSTAARECARAGLSVALMERYRLPRPKLCGGGLSNHCLNNLGVELPASLIQAQIKGAIIQGWDSEVKITLKQRAGVLVDRAEFDHFLAKAAETKGATLLCDTHITGVERKADHIEVSSADGRIFTARLLIGADGVNGVCHRLVRDKLPISETGNCLEVFPPAAPEAVVRVLNDHCIFDFSAARYGYGWIFPHRSSVAVGIGGFNEHFREPHAIMESFLRNHSFDAEKLKIKGFPIPAGGFKRPISAERVLLCGDAAGFVDPFLGEGISYAVLSGRLAAQKAIEAVRNSRFDAASLRAYDRAAWKEFASDLRWALWLTRVLHGIPRRTLAFFIKCRPVLERFTQIVSGQLRYRSFIGWLLPRLPWLLLRSFFKKDHTARSAGIGSELDQ